MLALQAGLWFHARAGVCFTRPIRRPCLFVLSGMLFRPAPACNAGFGHPAFLCVEAIVVQAYSACQSNAIAHS